MRKSITPESRLGGCWAITVVLRKGVGVSVGVNMNMIDADSRVGAARGPSTSKRSGEDGNVPRPESRARSLVRVLFHRTTKQQYLDSAIRASCTCPDSSPIVSRVITASSSRLQPALLPINRVRSILNVATKFKHGHCIQLHKFTTQRRAIELIKKEARYSTKTRTESYKKTSKKKPYICTPRVLYLIFYTRASPTVK
jgi:hypothetical protein